LTINSDGNCVNSGDTAFILFATTMVMLQTPAMGLAQAGLIRIKNVISMLLQILSGAAICSLLFYLVGFSITFGPSLGGVIGDPFRFALFHNLKSDNCFNEVGGSIPTILYAAYQMTFALMVPLIITGAWAERMKYKAFLLFIILWSLLV